MHIVNEEIDQIFRVKDKFPNISSVTSNMGSQQDQACVARFPL